MVAELPSWAIISFMPTDPIWIIIAAFIVTFFVVAVLAHKLGLGE